MRKTFVPALLSFALIVIVACGPMATVATSTPMATNTPSTTASAVPSVTLTASLTSTPTQTPTSVVMYTSVQKIQADRWANLGNKIGGTVVFDQAAELVVIIPQGTTMRATGAAGGTSLAVTVYANKSMDQLAELAEAKYPDAKTYFWAEPSFILMQPWTAVLPDGWIPVVVPNGLIQADYSQPTVANPRTADLKWSVVGVTCRKYLKDPGNLPEGIRWDRVQSFHFTDLKESVDLMAVCGNRKDGILSAWATRFDAQGSNTQPKMLQLMAKAMTWMWSTSMDDPSMSVQDFLLGGATNVGRYIVGADGIFGWDTAPDEWVKKGN
jgi:hypothetical protein